MNIISTIQKTENEFPKLFANWIEKDYGILFYDENNKDSHDSNHAILFHDKSYNVNTALCDITEFYVRRRIIPRIYQPFIAGFFDHHRQILESHHYSVIRYGINKYMLLTGGNSIQMNTTLTVRRIVEWDDRIAEDIFIPSNEAHEIPVVRKLLTHKNAYVFVGYRHNTAVVITYFHRSEYDCTRFHYILTAKDQRKKGYARELLRYVVEFCQLHHIMNCYQWPVHRSSETMCAEAGFRVVFEAEGGAAIYHKHEN